MKKKKSTLALEHTHAHSKLHRSQNTSILHEIGIKGQNEHSNREIDMSKYQQNNIHKNKTKKAGRSNES